MAQMLYVTDVGSYFRELVDEPSGGFMENALAQKWLEIGHNHYNQFVSTADPERFFQSHSMTLTNAFEFDLNGVLLGSAATAATRMASLIRVVELDQTTLRPNFYFYPVASREQLDSWDSCDGSGRVLLAARKLYFSHRVTADCRIDYVPVPNVDWSKTAPADTEFIDDVIQFHDMIALYGALQYFASAGYSSPEIEQLLLVRQQQFKSTLQRSRSLNAARYVQNDDAWGW